MIVSAAQIFFPGERLQPDSYSHEVSVPEDISELFQRNAEEDLRETRRIVTGKEKFEKAEAVIQKRIASLEKQLDDLRKSREENINFPALKRLKHISYIYGTVKNSQSLPEMKSSWFYIQQGESLLVLSPVHERSEVISLLNESGFTESAGGDELNLPGDAAEHEIEMKLGMLRGRLERLVSLYKSGSDGSLRRLRYLSDIYSVILKISGAESNFLSTDELVVITGWLDMEDAESLRGLLSESAGESYFLRIASLKENRGFRGRIPVLLKNIKLFRPFEFLVRMMGTPGNSEVDPTPVAAIAYTVIFGVMFGDLGQGLTLAAAGVFLLNFGKRKYKERNSISDFGGIMIWCGFSAAFFGILYGSVFSYEHLIPALLFHPMENMMELFLIAIMIGVIFISAGLIFNVANGLLAGHYGEALFGTKGLSGLAVYLSVVFFVMRYIFYGVVPGASSFAGVLLPPAILFTLRGPLDYLLFRGEAIFPHGLFEYIVESMVEIIEMFSGFLGNTISFIRAGAFALSHAGLSMAVFTLAAIIDPSIKSAGAIAAIVTGNIFIILLEGLGCSIQSMRLEYYEFFGKFFKGDGVAFAPFSFKFR
jgi:V/A-type H+-transporting ATPase subunit I